MNVFSNVLCSDTLFSVAELGLVLTMPEKFENGGHSENASKVFRPHYAKEN